ncbi:MAG: aspartate aminotransferase family protein [Lachnospirales bacterium]
MIEKDLRDELLQGKKDYMFPDVKMYFYNEPPIFSYGKMQYLYGVDGKKYTDFFAGVSVMICGHSNEFILERTIEQLKKLQHKTIIYLDENIVKLAKKLAEVLPGNINKTFFTCSGSEANEGAFLLARRYTNKEKFINIENALHGRTYLTMAATTIPMWKMDPYEPDIFYTAKGFWQEGVDLETSAKASVESIKNILESHNDIAAFIVEPLQGNGGILTPPLWYYKEVKSLLEKHNVLMIVDEVQTGYARTGKMFGIDNYDVVPDIMVTAKALSGGFPIATFSTTTEIAKVYNKASASTFGGNPVACANSLAILEYIEKENLVDRSVELGKYLKEQLLTISSNYIKEIRGMGLMLGIEITCENANVRVDNILEEMKNRGFILGKSGVNRNVVVFQPPLVIEKSDIDNMVVELKEVINLEF